MSKKHARKKIEEAPVEVPAAQPDILVEEPMEEPEAFVDNMDVSGEMPYDDRRKKLTALWLAVGGSTAVIVALWFMLLPVQIGDLRLPDTKDLARWRAMSPAMNTNMSLEDSLVQIRSRLEKLTNSSQSTATQPPNTVVNIEALRQKLEAAALRNEAAVSGTNTNEAKE